MEVLWVVIISALTTLCLNMVYRKGYWTGYKAGAGKVLEDWKYTIHDEDDGR